MKVIPRVLVEYIDTRRKNPFRDWLTKLRDIEARAKIRVRLNRVRLGNPGDIKSIGHGVFELRIPHGPGYRVYFAEENRTVVLLLCGGNKSTQARDISRAKKYWMDYQGRSS